MVKKEKKYIYIVMAQLGEYEDYEERPFKMFNTEKEAQEFSVAANKALQHAYALTQELCNGREDLMIKIEASQPHKVEYAALLPKVPSK